MALDKDTILSVIGNVTEEMETYEHRNQLTVKIPKEKLIETCKELKNNEKTKFNHLVDITAIDWLDKREHRFEVAYFMNSLDNNQKLILKVDVDEDNTDCPSVTSVWKSANWYERETYDMYGIQFQGHPNLRRFYMPEDYEDPETGEQIHPLRKDFPLMGIPGSIPLPPYPEKYGEADEEKENKKTTLVSKSSS